MKEREQGRERETDRTETDTDRQKRQTVTESKDNNTPKVHLMEKLSQGQLVRKMCTNSSFMIWLVYGKEYLGVVGWRWGADRDREM